jgi:hypothetical protein
LYAKKGFDANTDAERARVALSLNGPCNYFVMIYRLLQRNNAAEQELLHSLKLMSKPRNSSNDADVINNSNLDVNSGVNKVIKKKIFSFKIVVQTYNISLR